MAKDFSVIAQGADGGEITITHWKGLQTASLPLIGGSTPTVSNTPTVVNTPTVGNTASVGNNAGESGS